MALKPTETGQHPVAAKPPPPPPKPKPKPPAVVPHLGRALTPQEVAYIQGVTRAQNIANNPSPVGLPLDAQGMIDQLPPDVRAIFNSARDKAAAGQPITPEAFQGQLVQTDWWKNTSATARDFFWKEIIDPASAREKTNQQAFLVLQHLQQLGITGMNLAQVANVAHASLMNGWTDDYLRSWLSNYALEGHHLNFGAGQVQTEMAQVHKTAQDYGITISNQAARTWGSQIAGGLKNQDAFTDYARYQAMLNHPYWARQIETGATTRQLADPWVQQAAQTLEISPDSIDITNPKWQFTTKDAHGNQTPMSVAQWNVHLMQDPHYGWDKTQNARNAAFQIVDQLQSAFGAK